MSPSSGRDARKAAATPLAAEGVDGAATGAAPRAFADAFDFCAAACRTHRRSTSHENAYVGARHHCFGRAHAVPLTAEPLPAAALDGVTVALSARGRSCAEACAAGGAAAGAPSSAVKALGAGAEHAAARTACSPQRLRALDGSCDALRTVADCEAGCDARGARPDDDGQGGLGEAGLRRAARMAPSWPGYVDEQAAKSARPAMCVVNGVGGGGAGDGAAGKAGAPTPAPAYDCAAKDKDVLRLCACVAPP